MCELDECVFWEMRLVIDTSFRFDVWCLFLVHIFLLSFGQMFLIFLKTG